MGRKVLRKETNQDWELQVIPGAYYIDFDKEDSINKPRKRTMASAKKRNRRKKHKMARILFGVGVVYLFAVSLPTAGKILLQGRERVQAEQFLDQLEKDFGRDDSKELQELLEKNEETYDFVIGYSNRADYMGKEIDLSGEFQSGHVPLLLQWDMRWGYDSYGQDMIAIAGCGPTCMTMAYLYLTEDTSMNPRAMAKYAYEGGFYTQAGTSWDFFTTGATNLGMSGKELPLGETQIKNALDEGSVVICSMRPGDFTTTGHFILLRSYDEKGFYVNDPNSRRNSEKQWDFDRLSSQIKCLWRIGK